MKYTTDPATLALVEFSDPTKFKTFTAKSNSSNVPPSTLWHRANGRPSKEDKAASQQYLTPPEEDALADYVLRMARNGYPLPVKFLRSLAWLIVRQRSSIFQLPPTDDEIPPPGHSWYQGFLKRHHEVKARRAKALDWKRHDHHIYDKVVEWFQVIGPELQHRDVDPANVYNMDETGVMLSVLNSLKVLVDRDDLRKSRGTCGNRTMITAVECISADGRCLNPLIIWPAATHRSTWTTHPTPGWHFACSKSGYTDTAISLYWVRNAFDPQTRDRAAGKPRILISDGFGTHESLEVLEFCYRNNIILCRLPSHTSHKLQPCDVGVFGPLKAAYREQAEKLYRGGSNTVGKQHFTYLYSKARRQAFSHRNALAGWSKTGLFPFNPGKVFGNIQRPPEACALRTGEEARAALGATESIISPTTCEGLASLCSKIEHNLHTLGDVPRLQLQKILNATEKAFAERNLLREENRALFEQNNEKAIRKSERATVVGHAKIMTYEDIVKKREEAARGLKRRQPQSTEREKKRSRGDEAISGRQEIRAWGLEQFCSVLDL
jgi:hypothetical protein